jgi:transposase-like protein
MSESEEVKVRKRRSSQEIRRLVTEFESSGLRQVEFCRSHGLALSTLQRGLKRHRTKAAGQGESERLVEVKIDRSRRSGSTEGSVLEVLLGKGRRIEVRRDFDAETLVRLIRTIEEI